MSKRNTFLMILTAFAISIFITIMGFANSLKGERTRAAENTSESSLPQLTVSAGYCLKAYDGGLAVFRGSSKTPYKKIEFDLLTMTQEDKQLLEEGIYVNTEEEIRKLIEDYGS